MVSNLANVQRLRRFGNDILYAYVAAPTAAGMACLKALDRTWGRK